MIITCTKQPRAIAAEANPHTHAALNLHRGVALEVVGELPGYDTTPIIIDSGCGHVFEIPDDRVGWDVNTAPAVPGERHPPNEPVPILDTQANPLVIERHLAPRCPSCGRTADHLSEPVDSVPMDVYVRDVRDAFLARVVGDELLSQTPEEIRDALWRGLPRNGDVYLKGVDEHGIPRLGALPSGGADAGYTHMTEGAVALAAATAKTIIAGKAGSAVGLSWTGLWIGFDGVTAANAPVALEAIRITFSANSPGTNSTGTTEVQTYGLTSAADWTGGRNWTTEPTVVTVIAEGSLTPNGGVIWYDDPLGKEPDCALSTGFGIRCNAANIVNVRATQKFRHS